jgi:glycoprotein endo-alpha-1,2-mannosidase
MQVNLEQPNVIRSTQRWWASTRRRQFSLLLASLLLAAMACAQKGKGSQEAEKSRPLPNSLTSSAIMAERMQSAGAINPERRVLALYYPWYRSLKYSQAWAHQDAVDMQHKTMASHTHFPVLGPYDSSDPTVIDWHLEQAHKAGIDTLVCSWWGAKDPTGQAFRQLLARAALHDMKVCILWEQCSRPVTAQTLGTELGYILETFGNQPAYLKQDGKPVVFAFERVCKMVSRSTWAQVFNAVNKKYAPGVIIIGDGQSQGDTILWDGLYNLGITFDMAGSSVERAARIQHDASEALILLGRRIRRISVVTIAPGYDDRKASSASGNRPSLVMDRQNGKLYSQLWQQAIEDSPDWILINSFNQWHAGTEIEPSVELGDQYMKLTHDYTAQFKQHIANVH